MASFTPPRGGALRFGVFELDLDAQELRRAGILIRLQPQPFRALALLVSRAGQIVTRDELRHLLWGDKTFVDFDLGLNYCIRQIRAALGDVAQSPRYVETVTRRGYRFILPIPGTDAPRPQDSQAGSPARPGARRWARLALPSALLLGLAAATVVRMTRPWGERKGQTILLLDVANGTGDPIFDGTLRQGLSAELEQSPVLNLLSDRRIGEVLEMMGRPRDDHMTPEVATQVCRRAGATAIVAGTIRPFGSGFVVGLDALDCQTGDLLGAVQVEAPRKEEVLKALGSASGRLRERLGESLASLQRFNAPVEQATTPSLEALQYFSLGVEKREREGALASMPFFKRAIEIDPDFALAHARLGVDYLNLEELEAAAGSLRKALSLANRVSERERLYISGHYHNLMGDKQEEIRAYEAYSRLYPRDPIPEVNLAGLYGTLGRFDEEREHALKGLLLAPGLPDLRSELARAHAASGRLAEARSVLAEGVARAPGSWLLHYDLSNLALAQGDGVAQNREDSALRTSPEGALSLLYRDAALAVSRGRLRQARELYAEIRQLALGLKLQDNASFAVALRAIYEAYLLEPARARHSAEAALRMSRMPDTVVPAAMALAAAGDGDRAQALILQLARRRPEDTIVNQVWVPVVRALVSLSRGEAEEAIRVLGPAVPYDRANLDPMLVRANAFLQAKRTAEAKEEFGRVVALRARFPFDPACALAQLGLARAHAVAGEEGQSRDAYQVVLGLWKDADSDIPLLKEAMAEEANLAGARAGQIR